jgi:hypothetical protein
MTYRGFEIKETGVEPSKITLRELAVIYECTNMTKNDKGKTMVLTITAKGGSALHYIQKYIDDTIDNTLPKKTYGLFKSF